jgi:two-component system invasion response regulator UvrY
MRRMNVAGRTIMLVDDHAVVREGYRSVLEKQPGLRVVAEAADGAEAYRLFKEAQPDLVIMDLAMPGIGGIEAIRRIRQWDRDARILVFTMHQNAAFAVQAIRAGAKGYVTKTSPPEALVRAVMEVFAGRIAVSPDIDHELALSRLAGETAVADVLTAREFEVMRMLLAECTTEEIADRRQSAFPDQGQARRRLGYRAGPARAAAGHSHGDGCGRGMGLAAPAGRDRPAARSMTLS